MVFPPFFCHGVNDYVLVIILIYMQLYTYIYCRVYKSLHFDSVFFLIFIVNVNA